jgi:4-hydroxyphenylpyruvate dioxygenase-like putative hemolysin
MASHTPITLQHVNLTVPAHTLDLAREFYGEVIGFVEDPVPQLQRDTLLWSVSRTLSRIERHALYRS